MRKTQKCDTFLVKRVSIFDFFLEKKNILIVINGN